MIYEVEANLLEFDKIEAFGHQANCMHTMGSGIARQIREKYPELYEADCKQTRRGDVSKMGKFSFARLHDGKMGYNIYSQYSFGMEKRHTNYEAIYNGLELVKRHCFDNNINSVGFPKFMGCKLGGGDWKVVRAIFESIFGEDSRINCYICNYDPAIQPLVV